MIEVNPVNQIRLFGLDKYINELVDLYKNDKLPNKILLSGEKSIGKSTLAYHFINYVLSDNEECKYNIDNFSINPENHSYKTLLNKSNSNFIHVNIRDDKKFIDINQIRELITNLNKTSFNIKPRFILIDNIEFLNNNSINALLKILEEPSDNVYFILINNNKKVLPTLLSRCINIKISLSNAQCLEISNKLLNGKLFDFINKDLINYYISPGNVYKLSIFGKIYKCDLVNLNLRDLIKIIIDNKYYKKDNFMQFYIFDLMELYFHKLNYSFAGMFNDKYSFFLKKISDTKKFNLDEESLFMDFEEQILNG